MKKVLGLILELNPLHNGHKYFIEKAINDLKPDTVIAITSTNFTMRGEISVINKFEKTKRLLDLGVDIVLELPFIGTVCSADYFAYNCVNALNQMGVTDIACGVELDNLDKLKLLNSLTKKDSFQIKVKEYLDQGFSYSTACNKALFSSTSDEELIVNYSLPNNTLALQYLKAINKINPKININLIKRISNNYFDENITGEISSATSIRNLIKSNNNIIDISKYVPFDYSNCLINIETSENNLYNLVKYKFINSNITDYLGIKEGIENRISNNLDKSNSLNELITNSQTKRYSSNYIRRLLLHIVMETSKVTNQEINYLRVLGFNKDAKKYINKLQKEIKEKIITSPKNSNNYYCLNELKATKLYDIITNSNIYKDEYKIPIIKED